MQFIMRFNLMPHKSEAFQDWLKKNDKLLQEGQPEGWQYLGAWFTVRNLGNYDCEMRFELDDYAALGSDFGSDALQQAWGEGLDYIAPNPGETCLMKSSEDVIIMKGT